MMNARLPPGVTLAQFKTAGECPFHCQPDNAFRMLRTLAHLGPGGVVSVLHSRCDSCLGYWETDTSGKIIKLKRPQEFEICPDCRRPMEEAFDRVLGLGKNLCKNPGHVASKLVGP